MEALRDLTGGIGPDACIDAVGMEAHGTDVTALYDKVEQGLMMETDRPTALRQIFQAARKGGNVSIPGVYGGALNKLNFGAAFGKGLNIKMGQTHMHRYLQPLLQKVEDGLIDPSFLISHRIGMQDVPDMYKIWRDKKDNVTKIVIDPWRESGIERLRA